jgi:hypothetical protein
MGFEAFFDAPSAFECQDQRADVDEFELQCESNTNSGV